MKRFSLIILTASLAVVGVYAQMGGPPPPHEGFGHMGFPFGGGPFHKVVTGAPYSATATEQFSQTLPGSNTIQRTTTSQVARDSEGRTYAQQTITGGFFGAESTPKTLVFISDPVAGYTYVLDAGRKVAMRRPLKTPPSNGPHERGAFGRSRKNNPNVNVASSTGTYQGLDVDIKTITRTIPAGAIGNSAAIVSTSTIEIAPSLQIVVYSTRNDPRTGQSTYSLSNISTSEPNASLFQIPAGYSVQDATMGPHRPGRRP